MLSASCKNSDVPRCHRPQSLASCQTETENDKKEVMANEKRGAWSASPHYKGWCTKFCRLSARRRCSVVVTARSDKCVVTRFKYFLNYEERQRIRTKVSTTLTVAPALHQPAPRPQYKQASHRRYCQRLATRGEQVCTRE